MQSHFSHAEQRFISSAAVEELCLVSQILQRSHCLWHCIGATGAVVAEEVAVAEVADVGAAIGVAIGVEVAAVIEVAADVEVVAGDIFSAVKRSKVVLPSDPPAPKGKALKGGGAKWKRICLDLAFEVVAGCSASA